MLKRPKEATFEFPQPPAPYPPSQRSGALILEACKGSMLEGRSLGYLPALFGWVKGWTKGLLCVGGAAFGCSVSLVS